MIKLARRPRRAVRGLLATAAVLCMIAPRGWAHHSFSMFDTTKIVTISGTVQAYVWRMPHTWLQIAVPTKDGLQSWGFECHAPTLIERKGWTRNSLKPGDKITLRMHPVRDGSREGSVIDVKLPDGTSLWNADTVTSP